MPPRKKKPKPLIDPGPRLAELIAAKLRVGIIHPGDPDHGIPSRVLSYPAFRPGGGMPKEMAELVNESTRLLGEAIVSLIRSAGDLDLIPRGEYVRLSNMETRTGGGQPFQGVLPVHCHCDTGFVDPLLVLTTTDNPRIVVDGQAFLQSMTRREIAHPHLPKD